MKIGIYAIRDTAADSIIGGLHMFKHDAVAVRFFMDIASDHQTMVARHLADHEIVKVGDIEESGAGIQPPHDNTYGTTTDWVVIFRGATLTEIKNEENIVELAPETQTELTLRKGA